MRVRRRELITWPPHPTIRRPRSHFARQPATPTAHQRRPRNRRCNCAGSLRRRSDSPLMEDQATASVAAGAVRRLGFRGSEVEQPAQADAAYVGAWQKGNRARNREPSLMPTTREKLDLGQLRPYRSLLIFEFRDARYRKSMLACQRSREFPSRDRRISPSVVGFGGCWVIVGWSRSRTG